MSVRQLDPFPQAPVEPDGNLDTICARCKLPCKLKGHAKVCASCREILVKRAQERQERAYLAAWLHTRTDKDGHPVDPASLIEARQVRRLVAEARRLGVDWTPAPPVGVLFKHHMVAVLEAENAPVARKQSRGPSQRKAAHVDVSSATTNASALRPTQKGKKGDPQARRRRKSA
jgi:hypothetical protein